MHRIGTAVAGTRVSRCYLVVCFALLVWVAVDSTLVHHEDASFAGIFPLVLTLPLSLAVVLLPGGTGWGALLVMAGAAVVNAALLGLLARSAGRRHHGTAAR